MNALFLTFLKAQRDVSSHILELSSTGLSIERAIDLLGCPLEEFKYISARISNDPSVCTQIYKRNLTFIDALVLKEREIDTIVAMRMLSSNYFNSVNKHQD